MLFAYNKSLLTKNAGLIDLALWLTQSDNLHLIQWFGRSGSEAEVSAYFTPDEWWQLGTSDIAWETQQVYKNFVQAMDAYLLNLKLEAELRPQKQPHTRTQDEARKERGTKSSPMS